MSGSDAASVGLMGKRAEARRHLWGGQAWEELLEANTANIQGRERREPELQLRGPSTDFRKYFLATGKGE